MKIIKSLATSAVLFVVVGNATTFAAKQTRKEKYQGTKLGHFFEQWSLAACSVSYCLANIWNPMITQEASDELLNESVEILIKKK